MASCRILCGRWRRGYGIRIPRCVPRASRKSTTALVRFAHGHVAQVVFKSLITLHTIMRSGSLDPVFSYLSSSSISLSLSGQEAANVAAYGHYLASRIKAYGNLKRDVIRDKSDRRAANRLRKLTVEQGLLRETREIQRMIAALVDSKVSLAWTSSCILS